MAKKDIAKAIGHRLAEARGDRWSQTDLAAALGVSRGAVGQWETGETAPSTENLAKAAIELGRPFEWLATGRGAKFPPPPNILAPTRPMQRVPLLSWVSAGRLADAGSQIPVEDVPLLAFADLGRGEFFALKVQGDSMDRVSPDGSIIVVNRADRALVAGKCYVFSQQGEMGFKVWRPEPDRFEPYSTNPANPTFFVRRKRDIEVIGRVRRTVLDL